MAPLDALNVINQLNFNSNLDGNAPAAALSAGASSFESDSLDAELGQITSFELAVQNQEDAQSEDRYDAIDQIFAVNGEASRIL